MKPSFLEQINEVIADDDLTLAYSGEFRDTLTDRIIELAQAYQESHNLSTKLRRKTSFLVAECFQNVIRHGSKEAELIFDSPKRVESFVVRFYANKCFILSENAIVNQNVDNLREMLDNVNKVDKDELRVLYRKVLEEGELSEKGGAGLGLIEMARRSDNKLLYSFQPLDENHTVFHLMLVLESTDDRDKEPDYTKDFKDIEKVIYGLKMDNQFLLYHGQMDDEMIEPVSDMIERNLDAQAKPLALKVKYYHAAMNIMHLIALQGKSAGEYSNSIISLGITPPGYIIHAVYRISKEMKSKVENLLSELKSYTPERWNEIFEKEHREFIARWEDEFAESFIQLARISHSWEYNFHSAGDDFELSYRVGI